MKNLLIIFLLFPVLLSAQSNSAATLFEVVNLEIKPGQEKAFEAAVKKHNTKFHADGSLHDASLFYNVNGPSGGQYAWIMGPTNFAAMDSRPTGGDHDTDWAEVSEHIAAAGSPTYWQAAGDLSAVGTQSDTKKSLVWIYDLKSGKTDRWVELVLKVKKVYETQRPAESMMVYWNQFADTKAGQDVALVFSFDKWAWLDRESTFNKDFETVHGEGTWSSFLTELRECVHGRVDFLREQVD